MGVKNKEVIPESEQKEMEPGRSPNSVVFFIHWLDSKQIEKNFSILYSNTMLINHGTLLEAMYFK